jgi:hypothetical protein
MAKKSLAKRMKDSIGGLARKAKKVAKKAKKVVASPRKKKKSKR